MYSRILLKLSGESLAGGKGQGIESESLAHFAQEVKSAVDSGVGVGIVLGGGNIFRGLPATAAGFDRVQGDYMGMLATLINAMALQGALRDLGLKAEILSGIPVDRLCRPMSRLLAEEILDSGAVLIIAGGTGNPYFTTDTAAALRALEIRADVLVKGTRVDGVYSADPEKDSSATRFAKISLQEAYELRLGVMDLTAFALCLENKLPVLVYDSTQAGNLLRALTDRTAATLVHP
jgi:uridylate kinase